MDGSIFCYNFKILKGVGIGQEKRLRCQITGGAGVKQGCVGLALYRFEFGHRQRVFAVDFLDRASGSDLFAGMAQLLKLFADFIIDDIVVDSFAVILCLNDRVACFQLLKPIYIMFRVEYVTACNLKWLASH